jgi:putative ABC transport system permease protein
MKFLTGSFVENFKMAIATLRANKLRSVLTIVGVVIGVMTVMLMSSIISGINVAVEHEVEQFGTRSIFLYKMDLGLHAGPPTREERMRKPLTLDDVEALTKLPTLEVAVPFLDISSSFFGSKVMVTGKNGKTSSAVNLTGTYPDIEKTSSEVLLRGRWFTQQESDDKVDVCLIGDSVREAYFPFEDPLGNTIEVGGRQFRIIGLLSKREQLFGGGSGNNDQSNIIYMPMGSALRIKPQADDLFIMAVAREGQFDVAKDQVQDLLRIRRRVPLSQKNNFSMETAASLIEQFQAITGGVFLAMVVISSVGLLIGGIGVMNIMLVSVTERTREIGIRKAIGARRTDILLQFLIEAVTLTGMGGVLGLLLGFGGTYLVKLIMPSYVP